MKYHRSERFKRELKKLPQFVKEAFYKQVGYLLENLQYPSLRAKKYDETAGVWQARVTKGWRFYFTQAP